MRWGNCLEKLEIISIHDVFLFSLCHRPLSDLFDK